VVPPKDGELARAWRLVCDDAKPFMDAVAAQDRIEFDPATGRVRGVSLDPFARARQEVPSLARAAIYAVNRSSGAGRPLARWGDPAGSGKEIKGPLELAGATVLVEVGVK
jgi:hypothetical protein